MPKMKTHRGAAKRFKVTGSGKIKKNHAFKRHQLECKTSKRKRNLRKAEIISHGDERRVERMLCL
ncbi:LSU ribosomal protein L35P [Hydrogenispora ethanolica]|jgi:large subunit ribosomal protein L35|uniref:Large ribosomal subunit protein bL35 n=1 Tax=Hydrogenispora ethanolica TaxID=1082276 RepID=A0A4R1R5Z7_HYDET|nr:50S ribosomal protein L35 [Hydrogenispora ethanolica]TCL60900.1 LSU ribosomal protein L35P [Hydrogenispora ethanolica]